MLVHSNLQGLLIRSICAFGTLCTVSKCLNSEDINDMHRYGSPLLLHNDVRAHNTA
jgi:hypothetical protein